MTRRKQRRKGPCWVARRPRTSTVASASGGRKGPAARPSRSMMNAPEASWPGHKSLRCSSGRPIRLRQLAASQEQDMQVMPQRTTMLGLHVYVAGLRAWCGQQPAQLDHLPGEGAPVPPSLLGLLQQNPADDLWHRAEDLGYAIREAVGAQNVPFRKAAHNRRAERIDHSADPGLADAVRAHRAWLDVAIKHVAAQPLPARCFLRTRQRDDFRVTRYVAVSDRAVDRLRDDLPVQSDDRAKGIFAFPRRDPRQLDATSHHRFVRCAA